MINNGREVKKFKHVLTIFHEFNLILNKKFDVASDSSRYS